MTQGKKKRLYINVADVRIAPDIISGYKEVHNTTNPNGLKFIFSNGRFLEIATSYEEVKETIRLLDELKEPQNIL